MPRHIQKTQVFILNLFCGQRRSGDIQYSVELELAINLIDVEIRVLSLDIILDPILGDLTCPDTVSTWATHIKEGRVQIVGGGASL